MTVNHAFPSSLVNSLVNYLFSGFKLYKWQLGKAVDKSIDSTWQEIKSHLYQLRVPESVVATGDKREARELNKLDSEYWLLIAAVELLSDGISPSEKSLVNWKLSELDEQRDFLLERLQPLKRKYYGQLNWIESFWNSCYSLFTLKVLRQEQELKKVQEILNDLVVSYVRQEPSSKEVLQEMLEALDEKTTKNPRLKTLYKTWRLLNWIYSYIETSTATATEDPVYSKFPVRARLDSYCYHLPDGCSNYPRVEKEEHKKIIKFFETVEEAEAEGLDLCGRCKIRLRRVNRNL